MEFNHVPQFNIEKAIKYYEKRDGVSITYVCTSDLTSSDVPMDIFYRSTPHPQFGNKYFGLFVHPFSGNTMITNADKIEDFIFDMIKDKDGKFHYSQSHHDCVFVDDKLIDGGRAYTRSSGFTYQFKVKNGKLEMITDPEMN